MIKPIAVIAIWGALSLGATAGATTTPPKTPNKHSPSIQRLSVAHAKSAMRDTYRKQQPVARVYDCQRESRTAVNCLINLRAFTEPYEGWTIHLYATTLELAAKRTTGGHVEVREPSS